MPEYRRNFVPGGTYFFTVNLLKRHDNDLLVRHIDVLRETVRLTRQAHPFHIAAWVVLPDHMHCIWTLPPGDTDYVNRWRLIKMRFSRAIPDTAIPGTEPLSASRLKRGERGIWQRRYWEHTVRDDRDYAAHIDYIHINPLKHGLVRRIVDWPFSSFHRMVSDGIYPANWAGEGLAEGLDYAD